jgi:hypothetical protein
MYTSKESLPYSSSVWTIFWLLSAKLSKTWLSLWSSFSYWMKEWLNSFLVSRSLYTTLVLTSKLSEIGLSLWSSFSYWMKDWVNSSLVSRTTDKMVCVLVEHSYWIDDLIVLGLKRTGLSNFRDVRDRTSKQDWSYWSELLEKFGKELTNSDEGSRVFLLF